MKVIAIASTKGGVGKSTIALAFCDELSAGHGKTVLGIDFDAQCSLAKFFFPITKDQLHRGPDWWTIAGEAESDPRSWAALDAQVRRDVSTIRPDPKRRSRLDILPAISAFRPVDEQYDSRRFEGVDLGRLTATLRKRWQDLGYDYVVLDTPGNESAYQIAALEMADAVIIPTIPDKTSDQELAVFVDGISKEHGPGFWRRRITRIVISKIQLGRTDHIEEAMAIRRRWVAARSPFGEAMVVAERQIPQREAFGRNLHGGPHKNLADKYRDTGYPFIAKLIREVTQALG